MQIGNPDKVSFVLRLCALNCPWPNNTDGGESRVFVGNVFESDFLEVELQREIIYVVSRRESKVSLFMHIQLKI